MRAAFNFNFAGRRRFGRAAFIALSLVLAIWLAAAAAGADAPPDTDNTFGPFRWLSRSTSA